MSRYSIITLFLLFIACSNNDKNSFLIEYNKKDLPIQQGKVLVPTDSLYGPLYVEVDTDHLYLYDSKSKVPVSVFDKNTGTFVTKFGKPGRGPGEFETLGNIELTSTDDILLYDAQNFKVVEFDKNNLKQHRKEYKIKPLGIALEFRTLNDSINIVSGLIGDRMLAVYNSKGDFIRDLGSLKGDTLETIPVRQNVYRKSLTINKSQKKVAIAYRYTDLFEIYDISGEQVASIKGPFNELPIYAVKYERMDKVDKTRIDYISITSTEKYVYALFNGRKAFEPSNNVGNIIHVFDWDGNFIEAIKLEEYLFDIAADENYVYGLAFFPEFSILKYEI